jgi:anti-sigma factor RsiW
MTCQQLIDFIGRYRENELSSDERAEFDRHLAICPSCVAYLKTYEQTVLLAKASSQDAVPGDVPDSLVKGILAAISKVNVQ